MDSHYTNTIFTDWLKRCVLSWVLKDAKDKERCIFSSNEFRMEPDKYKDHAPALLRLMCGTLRSFWEEELRDLEGEYEDRQQEKW